jgi:hypothetical protein
LELLSLCLNVLVVLGLAWVVYWCVKTESFLRDTTEVHKERPIVQRRAANLRRAIVREPFMPKSTPSPTRRELE